MRNPGGARQATNRVQGGVAPYAVGAAAGAAAIGAWWISLSIGSHRNRRDAAVQSGEYKAQVMSHPMLCYRASGSRLQPCRRQTGHLNCTRSRHAQNGHATEPTEPVLTDALNAIGWRLSGDFMDGIMHTIGAGGEAGITASAAASEGLWEELEQCAQTLLERGPIANAFETELE